MSDKNEIKPVRRYMREGGSYLILCAHCKRTMYVEGPVKGEDYQDRLCGGWSGITFDAQEVVQL